MFPIRLFATRDSPLSCPSMRLYMLLKPNTFRKYQDAELTLQTTKHNNTMKNLSFCTVLLHLTAT